MSNLNKALAVVEGQEQAAALSALAQGLASQADVASAGAAGRFEDAFSSLRALVERDGYEVVIFRSTKRARLLAARLAASFKTAVLTDSTRVWAEGASVFSERMVYGGSALRVEKAVASPAIVLVSDGLLASQEATGAPASTIELEFEAASGVSCTEVKKREAESVNLAAAKRVVSIGRGLEKDEDLALINDLAATLGAEVGCTRPIAEGVCWLARERYIGVSGAMLKPDLFIAIGLSGQIQHMVGANKSKCIIAVNKDKNATIFKQCDYGIVGDLYSVVPKLTAALKQ
jgi:electron transfer flavoprotein alpha subunit